MSYKTQYKSNIMVIGARQAGLFAAYHSKKLGLAIVPDFIVLDAALSAVVHGKMGLIQR